MRVLDNTKLQQRQDDGQQQTQRGIEDVLWEVIDIERHCSSDWIGSEQEQEEEDTYMQRGCSRVT